MTPSGMWIAAATPVRYTSSMSAWIVCADGSVHASQAGRPMGGESSPRLCHASLTDTRMWRGPLNTHTVGVGNSGFPQLGWQNRLPRIPGWAVVDEYASSVTAGRHSRKAALA